MTGTPLTSLTCAQVRDDLPAYALGILDTDEQAEVEDHLTGCPDCQSALRRFEATVGTLGAAVEPVAPPTELRAALLSEIRTAPASAAGRSPTPLRLSPFLSIGLSIAAVMALVAAVSFGVLFNAARQQRDAARQGQAEMAEYLKNGGALSPLLPAKGAPADVAADHGSLALAPKQNGAMIFVYDLAPTNAGQRYMVWAQRGQNRVKLGELHVDKNGAGWMLLWGPEPMSTYDVVGINRFTSSTPQGEPFLVAQMPKTASARVVTSPVTRLLSGKRAPQLGGGVSS